MRKPQHQQCDNCHAVVVYGLPLQIRREIAWPGPRESTIFLCEVCTEIFDYTRWQEWDAGPFPFSMSPPHRTPQ